MSVTRRERPNTMPIRGWKSTVRRLARQESGEPRTIERPYRWNGAGYQAARSPRRQGRPRWRKTAGDVRARADVALSDLDVEPATGGFGLISAHHPDELVVIYVSAPMFPFMGQRIPPSPDGRRVQGEVIFVSNQRVHAANSRRRSPRQMFGIRLRAVVRRRTEAGMTVRPSPSNAACENHSHRKTNSPLRQFTAVDGVNSDREATFRLSPERVGQSTVIRICGLCCRPRRARCWGTLVATAGRQTSIGYMSQQFSLIRPA